MLIILVVVVAYVVLTIPTSPTILSMDPQSVQGIVGGNFTIKVNISNVADLFGWELRLNWNASLLSVTNITEGSFLRSKGATFFSPQLNSTGGYLVADCTLTGDVAGASGQGTLVIIQFQVEGNGDCDLNLYDTQLLNASAQTINHIVHNDHFSM